MLAAGAELLAEGGYDALTIAEVCRRARVSAPSIYARVDGREALFRAVYAHAMDRVVATEDEELGSCPRTVAGVTRALVEVFSTHTEVLRAVISRAADDPALMAAGAETSRRLTARAAALMADAGAGSDSALAAARHVYVECTFRTMYGDGFWGETDQEFLTRLVGEAERLAAL